MITSESEIITIQEEKRVRRIIKCDVCGKIIEDRKVLYNEHKWNLNEACLDGRPAFRYSVETGHNDWGNDSVDSHERKDVCSDECLKKLFDQYIKGSFCVKLSPYGTQFFNVLANPDKVWGWSF